MFYVKPNKHQKNSEKSKKMKFSESLDIVEKMMCAKFQVSSYPFDVQYMGN